MLTLLTLLLGCEPAPSPDPDDSAADDSAADDSAADDSAADDSAADDSAADDSAADTGPIELNGQRPAVELPLPDFLATSHLGEARGPEHLRGHPTVLWFFPIADSFG